MEKVAKPIAHAAILEWRDRDNREKTFLHRIFGRIDRDLYVKEIPPYAYRFKNAKEAERFLEKIKGKARIFELDCGGAILLGPIYIKDEVGKYCDDVIKKYGEIAEEIYMLIQKIEHGQILQGICPLCPFVNEDASFFALISRLKKIYAP